MFGYMLDTIPAQIPPGGFEIVIVLLVLVLLFGAQKIPKLARSTGQAMGEFKRGREEIEEELEDMQDSDSSGGTETVSSTTDTPDTGTPSTDTPGTDAGTESETEAETERTE